MQAGPETPPVIFPLPLINDRVEGSNQVCVVRLLRVPRQPQERCLLQGSELLPSRYGGYSSFHVPSPLETLGRVSINVQFPLYSFLGLAVR